MPWTRFATRLLDGEFEIRSNAVVRDRKRSGKRDESVHWTLYLVSKNPGRNEKKKKYRRVLGFRNETGVQKGDQRHLTTLAAASLEAGASEYHARYSV